ncbi:MAG: NTP transferase domain-containing protein [Dethiobacter sp.]|nr:NTP transferase domain-containing protein [Dethiobacter sp.]
MKGLILAGGTGSRIRPFSLYTAKQLLPVLNKPVLFHNIDLLLAGGIVDIGIVVGPMKDFVVEAINNSVYSELANIHFIEQPEPKGLAHAVSASQVFLADDDFVMILGDNLFTVDTLDLLYVFENSFTEALVALVQVEEPKRYGIANMENYHIISVEEKPKVPQSNWAIAGLYIFKSTIHEVIRNLKPSHRNEYEITDAIQQVIEKKQTVTPYFLKGYWRDIGTLNDLFDINIDLLQDINLEGTYFEALFSSFNLPVLIDKTAVIINSVIGPNVIIGPNTQIRNSQISNSIVLENTLADGVNLDNMILSPWGNREVSR